MGKIMEITSLKDLVKLTDGNLSTHLSVLEQAGYIAMIRASRERSPKPESGLPPGQRRFFQICRKSWKKSQGGRLVKSFRRPSHKCYIIVVLY
jgi:DNA-binding transcriptional ArsR family regulator